MKELRKKMDELEKKVKEIEIKNTNTMLKKEAEKKLRKLENRLSKLPVTIGVFTYIQLYHTLQQMFFQEDYRAIIDICDAVCSRKQ